jgi:hypothetical protein
LTNDVPEFAKEADVRGLGVLLFDPCDVKTEKMKSLIFNNFQDRDAYVTILESKGVKINKIVW